jgi:hypothetical protein
MKSVGVTYDVMVDYRDEVVSGLVSNFIGELMIRENIDKFAKIIMELGDNYLDRVNKFHHEGFGNRIWKDKFIFTFHISLVQRILTEKFCKKMV